MAASKEVPEIVQRVFDRMAELYATKVPEERNRARALVASDKFPTKSALMEFCVTDEAAEQ